MPGETVVGRAGVGRWGRAAEIAERVEAGEAVGHNRPRGVEQRPDATQVVEGEG